MSRQTTEQLENIYTSMYNDAEVIVEKSMTVGSTPTGDLPGPTKKQGPKGSGSESTDAEKAEEAPEGLQGDTVEDSKKGKQSVQAEKTSSKFQELYQHVVQEELDGGSVEGGSFQDEIGDFPPAGEDEEMAERGLEGEVEEQSLSDLFRDFGDIVTKIADKYAEEEGVGEGDMITDEGEIPEGEEMAGEAVESTPAPDGVSKHTAKGSQNVKGVKVVKKAVSSASSGQEDGGKPKAAPATTLGPKTKLKANGSGPAAEGKDKSFLES